MENIDEYVWRRRIHHGVRNQKSVVPFPESVQIRLDFNAASERKDKLDLSLLTNGVMLELCRFARTVTRSEMFFLFEMLEFNFDLGFDVDNDHHVYHYTARMHNKIKQLREQVKTKPSRWKESFPLPDVSFLTKSAGPVESGQYYLKRNKMVDSSVLTLSSEDRKSAEHQKSESNGTIFVRKGRGRVGDAYPFCRDLGVTLFVRHDDPPKEKLDRSLVSIGVMMEMLNFSRLMCGNQPGIVHDLIKQNFGYEFDKSLFRTSIAKLMERKNASVISGDKDAFQKEVFNLTRRQERKRKRKKAGLDDQDLECLQMSGKRRATPRIRDSEDFYQDSDLSYMCPVDFETEMQSVSEAGPTQIQFERISDVKQEEEEVFVSQPCPKKKSLSVSDLFSEDQTGDLNVKTHRQKLWLRRAQRSKQILKSSRLNDMFSRCREIGFDFNVASVNRQNLDLQLLTNRVLWEVSKFSTMMTKSLRAFLLEILHNNFSVVLLDEMLQRNFTSYIISKVKILQNHPDAEKMEFLDRHFQFPEVYNMVDVSSDMDIGQEAEAEPQNNREPQSSATSQMGDEEPHPFCEKIGLSLWSTEGRPAGQKLNLTVLTNGAVLEVFGFVRELCGSVREIVNDVLEHNFDLDLQSGATAASQVIQRWYYTQRSLMKRQTTSPKIIRWLNSTVPLNGPSQLGPRPPTANGLDHLEPDDIKQEAHEHTEEKKINRYNFCEEIGLDLNIRSKPKAKTKLDLGVLKRGVLLEMHRYVERNCNRYVPALYEILEYNFDLSSQDHRRVEFAWSVASQVLAIAGKHDRKGDYLNRVIELPIEGSQSSEVVCKEEPDDGFYDPDLNDSDVLFVRELKPVDIEVEID